MFEFLVIFLLFLCGIQSQVPYFGRCPEVTVEENFDLNKYMGKWYETLKYINVFELLGKCIEAEYSLNGNGTVTVRNSQIFLLTTKRRAINGNARPAGSVKEAKLIVDFSVLGFHRDAPYWVLETDYESYSVVWSCTNFPLINTRFAWILTRERNPSDTVIAKAKAVLDKFRISSRYLAHTNQSKCPNNNK